MQVPALTGFYLSVGACNPAEFISLEQGGFCPLLIFGQDGPVARQDEMSCFILRPGETSPGRALDVTQIQKALFLK